MAMLSGEAAMGIVWNTRAKLLEQDSGGKIKYVWDQGLLSPGALAVMTGVAFILYTNYMVTDPGTTPSKPAAQFAFAARQDVADEL